jgi:hypothetical protein
MTYHGKSRRNFLKTLTTTALVAPSSLNVLANFTDQGNRGISPEHLSAETEPIDLPIHTDGPSSPLFRPLDIAGNTQIDKIDVSLISGEMAASLKFGSQGKSVAWGIPFNINEKIIHLKKDPFEIKIEPVTGKWVVFMHASDKQELERIEGGFYGKPLRGIGQLNEEVARYIVIYEDGSEIILPIRQRYQIGMFHQDWGENCIEAVAHHKPRVLSFQGEITNDTWGWTQTRVNTEDRGDWINWLWAWENPKPGKRIRGFRLEPLNKTSLILSAITVGDVSSNPLRWNSRQKAILTLPKENRLPEEKEEMTGMQLDLGVVISAVPLSVYPEEDWTQSYNNKLPLRSENEIIIEFTAHPEAMIYLPGKEPVPISGQAGSTGSPGLMNLIHSAEQTVKIKVLEKGTKKAVPVKFHAHGESGEYLAPVDRHRQPNISWFEDYSVDFVNDRLHFCTYIPGETLIKLPRGKVYLEISKGFEISPIRKVIEITGETDEIVIEIEKTLLWREKGWVTADTHVHFLSPASAMLEGSGEGVNIINLLASQWGELMTNVGDFDGKTIFGAKTSGGDGEYLVRVGTENRQHVMGHISLLGYEGSIILPMTTGGPDESALGDPVEMLLTEWAMQCKKQNGVVILPHFPNPRLENAAAIVSGGIDGVEMTSWGNLYGGIDPYSLSDWYRYLNCGYFVAAVGGTDKMSSGTAVGTVRTYAKIADGHEFTYAEWKESIKRGQTFVTYGPLVEFNVEGKPAGSRIEMSANGGTINISWEVASVTIPMSRVELIVNGEVKESVPVSKWDGRGNWSLKVTGSSWVAVMVRGMYPDKPEIIAAHTSPVMISLKDSPMIVSADALTILDQIEGAMAYLDTIGTRADDKIYKRMKLVLTSAHRTLHNRMHSAGYFHQHTSVNDHPEHH